MGLEKAMSVNSDLENVVSLEKVRNLKRWDMLEDTEIEVEITTSPASSALHLGSCALKKIPSA